MLLVPLFCVVCELCVCEIFGWFSISFFFLFYVVVVVGYFKSFLGSTVVVVVIIVCIFVFLFLFFPSHALSRVRVPFPYLEHILYNIYLYYGNMRFLTACAIWRTHSNWFDRIKWLVYVVGVFAFFWFVWLIFVCFFRWDVPLIVRSFLCVCVPVKKCCRTFAFHLIFGVRTRTRTIDIGIMK